MPEAAPPSAKDMRAAEWDGRFLRLAREIAM